MLESQIKAIASAWEFTVSLLFFFFFSFFSFYYYLFIFLFFYFFIFFIFFIFFFFLSTQIIFYQENDSVLNTLPLHHMHGLVNVMLCPLFAGGKVSFVDRFEPKIVWEALLCPKLVFYYDLIINIFIIFTLNAHLF